MRPPRSRSSTSGRTPRPSRGLPGRRSPWKISRRRSLTGVTPNLHSRALVAAAFSLLTVEARHAAWARHLSGIVPAAGPFDRAKPVSEVDRIVESTRFVSTLAPKMTARANPKFVGSATRASPATARAQSSVFRWTALIVPATFVLAVVLVLLVLESGASDASAPRASTSKDSSVSASLPGPVEPGFVPGKPSPLRASAHATRWAVVRTAVTARAAPRANAPAVTELKPKTPEGTSNIVLVLAKRVDNAGRVDPRATGRSRPSEHRLGSARGSRRVRDRHDASRRRARFATGDAFSTWARGFSRGRWDRKAVVADASRRVLHTKQADGVCEPYVRTGRVRYECALARPHRLARGRLRRDPRNRSARPSPRPRLAWLHSNTQRRHSSPVEANACRDAAHDPVT